MEVHHPHHPAHKKKWSEYLLEFVMLFAAVTLGFFAENIREGYIEKEHEHEYMVSMLEDLKSDIPILNFSVKEFEKSNSCIDSVADAISFPIANTDYKKVYRNINEALNPWSFKYNDRTTTQLKNAGGFRLIHNKKVASKIIAYDQYYYTVVSNIEAQHNSFYETAVRLRNKVFVEEIISKVFTKYSYPPAPMSANSMIDSMMNKNRMPVESATQEALMFEFKNALLAYKQDYRNNGEMGYYGLKQYQKQLIELITKEYHLEEHEAVTDNKK